MAVRLSVVRAILLSVESDLGPVRIDYVLMLTYLHYLQIVNKFKLPTRDGGTTQI